MRSGRGAGDGEVGHVDLLRRKVGRAIGFTRRQRTTEKGELEAVVTAVLAGQVRCSTTTGGVFVVGAMVAWELEGQRLEGAGEAIVKGRLRTSTTSADGQGGREGAHAADQK